LTKKSNFFNQNGNCLSSYDTGWDRIMADAASAAAAATAPLIPKRGRARPLAAKSVGHPDPGAISLALCAQAVGGILHRPGAEAP
jgi:dihydroxyacetone kinase